MIRAIIVEDDPISQEMLADLLSETEPNVQILARCNSVKSAFARIEKHKPELVFLDIELGEERGFDLLNQLGTFDFEVIVITSHDKYALEAIRHNALDYLVKPIKSSDVRAAVRKVEKRMQQRIPKPAVAQKLLTNKVAVPTFDGLLLLPTDQIIRISSDRNYSDFFLTQGKKVVVTKSLKEYEKLLTETGFIRIHHSHMINIAHLVKYVKGEGGYVIMSDNSSVDVSRRKKEEFLEYLARA